MHRFDRALGILLLLRGGSALTAAELARRFEVSTRTIYRDVEALSTIGVPVYAERGREGGIRLVEGYFIPPVTFTRDEAVSLLLGMTILRTLRARPFAAELDTAEEKLVAALPARLRGALAQARRAIGSEAAPADPFHPEPADSEPEADGATTEARAASEGRAVGIFLTGVLDGRAVSLAYRSPYRAGEETLTVAPLGVFWDRDRWYLVGGRAGEEGRPLIWRADRVLELRLLPGSAAGAAAFEIREVLGRKWLRAAMERWAREAPVKIRVSAGQAARLKQDWYYQHATYEQLAGGRELMTFGEDNRQLVFDLLRWLGPGAELVAPEGWRGPFREELLRMAAVYD